LSGIGVTTNGPTFGVVIENVSETEAPDGSWAVTMMVQVPG
jgi:hypothetical protein